MQRPDTISSSQLDSITIRREIQRRSDDLRQLKSICTKLLLPYQLREDDTSAADETQQRQQHSHMNASPLKDLGKGYEARYEFEWKQLFDVLRVRYMSNDVLFRLIRTLQTATDEPLQRFLDEIPLLNRCSNQLDTIIREYDSLTKKIVDIQDRLRLAWESREEEYVHVQFQPNLGMSTTSVIVTDKQHSPSAPSPAAAAVPTSVDDLQALRELRQSIVREPTLSIHVDLLHPALAATCACAATYCKERLAPSGPTATHEELVHIMLDYAGKDDVLFVLMSTMFLQAYKWSLASRNALRLDGTLSYAERVAAHYHPQKFRLHVNSAANAKSWPTYSIDTLADPPQPFDPHEYENALRPMLVLVQRAVADRLYDNLQHDFPSPLPSHRAEGSTTATPPPPPLAPPGVGDFSSSSSSSSMSMFAADDANGHCPRPDVAAMSHQGASFLALHQQGATLECTAAQQLPDPQTLITMHTSFVPSLGQIEVFPPPRSRV